MCMLQLASQQIRKIAGCASARIERQERFPHHQLQRKPLVCDPSMHHGTHVTHVPWCMSGSLTHGGGEHDPGIPGACATRNFTCLPRGPWQFSLQVFANPKEFYINDDPAGVAVDGIFFGQVSDKAEKMDCAFANTVTNHLFAQPPDAPSTDLPSLNVHRGRDHGLPSEFQGPVLLQWPCSVYRITFIMMTSSNGNIFRITGHLCGEFTGHRWRGVRSQHSRCIRNPQFYVSGKRPMTIFSPIFSRSAKSLSLLLVTWRRTKPGHQLSWYGYISTRIC